jgi:hypothetical protein
LLQRTPIEGSYQQSLFEEFFWSLAHDTPLYVEPHLHLAHGLVASNEFRGGLFKKKQNKFLKKLLCAFVCLSLGLKEPGDFTVSEGHRYPLVYLRQEKIIQDVMSIH